MPQVKTEINRAEMEKFREMMHHQGLTTNYSMLKTLVLEALHEREIEIDREKSRLETNDEGNNQGRNEEPDSTADSADPPFL